MEESTYGPPIRAHHAAFQLTRIGARTSIISSRQMFGIYPAL